MTTKNWPALMAMAAATAAAFLTSDPAGASLEVSNRSPRQGDTIEVTLSQHLPTGLATGADIKDRQSDSSTNHDDLNLTFNGNSYKFFPEPKFAKSGAKEKTAPVTVPQPAGDLKALIAVPADLEPGKYALQSGAESVTLTVRAGLFPLQHIHLPPAKNNFDTSPGEEEAVDRAKATLSAHRLWSGPFAPPSKARTSTGFGLKRVVNGRLLKDYFHSGLDFAGGLGSPITATANGNVVLVGRAFKLHGNTVAIDHGQGVISFYIHMKTIKVKEGEAVVQGEQIGTVGQTGRATGPHLHFSIYVNKVAANPKNWFSTSF